MTEAKYKLNHLVTLANGDGSIFAVVKIPDDDETYSIAKVTETEVFNAYHHLRYKTNCVKTKDYIGKIDAFLEKYFGRQNDLSEEQLRPAAGKDRRPPAPPLKTIEKAYQQYLKI